MKGKFVKKIERELRKLGCDKLERGDTTGWYKPKTYYLRVHYHGNILDTVGKNDLQAYKLALKLIKAEKETRFVTNHWLWVWPVKAVSDAECDFEGWAVINGMYGFRDCYIAEGAFSDNSGIKVPIMWNHNPDCLLGYGLLEARPKGLYFYGWFLTEENEHIRNAKALIQQGLVKTLSIKADQLKWGDGKVTKGHIIEVSLVLWNEQPPKYQDTLIIKHKEWDLNA